MTDVLATVGNIVGWVASLGGVAGIVAIVHVKRQGKKIDAETTQVDAEAAQVITAAATALVQPLTTQVVAMRLELDNVRYDAAVRDQLAAEHAGWDWLAEHTARAHGVELPPRPPLLPPRPPGEPPAAATVPSTTRH